MKVPGIPFRQGKHPQGSFGRGEPSACVLHMTYGSLTADGFAGAQNIGINGRGGVGIGFHFLAGKNQGQVGQYYDTTVKAAHAKGANDWALGFEFDGVNESVLTEWQVQIAAIIIAAVHDQHNIPLDYYDGPRKRVRGFLPHASVPGSTHTDRIDRAEWDRIVAAIGRPQCACPPEQRPPAADLATYVRARQALAFTLAVSLAKPDFPATLRPGSKSLYVVVLQKALNLVTGRGLVEDGDYGPATQAAITDFQRFFKIGADGVYGPQTEAVLLLALQRIATGQA